MSAFPIYNTATAPEPTREVLAALEEQVGFVPNLAGAMAGSPSLIAAFTGTRNAFAGAALAPVEREAVALAASFVLGSDYGVAAHSTVLGLLGADAALTDDLRNGRRPQDDCLALLTGLAAALATGDGGVQHRVEAALQGGYTGRHLLDVAAGTALAATAAYAYRLTGVPIDARFGS